MKKPRFKIGEIVQRDAYDNEFEIVGYALRDEMWAHRHLYKIKRKEWFGDSYEWVLENSLNKLVKK